MWEAQKKTPFFSKSNFSPLLKITYVHLVADAKSTWSNWQKGAKIPKEHPKKIELKPKQFDMNWHGFCLGLNSLDRPDLAPPYLPHPTISSLGTHTRQIALGTEKRLYIRFLARFARLVAQQAFEPGQKQMSACSTCSSALEHAPVLGPVRPHQATPNPAPAPIKHPEATTVLPSTLSAPPEHEFAGVLSTHGVLAATQACPSWTGHSDPPPSNLAPRLASLEPRKASWALRLNTTLPETPDCHRWTPADRRRTWTELHDEPFSNSLHPRHHWLPVKLPEHFDWALPPWAGRSTHNRRVRPPAHAASPPPFTTVGDPQLDVTARDRRTLPNHSPDLYHRW
jgi:hypothetical protein